MNQAGYIVLQVKKKNKHFTTKSFFFLSVPLCQHALYSLQNQSHAAWFYLNTTFMAADVSILEFKLLSV